MPTPLEKQILATISYYDILNYPLTGFEVFLYLVMENENGENKTELNSEASELNSVLFLLNDSEYLKKYISQKDGFYFLRKRCWLHSPHRSGAVEPECEPFANRLHSPAGTMEPTTKQSRNNVQRNLNTGFLPAGRQGHTPFIPRNDSNNNIDIVQQRLNRKKLADRKWKKIKKIFWIMQIAPFMKMVLVSGSLALGNSRKESDVDLIIIAKKGRIWTARTFVTLLTSLLGVRRYKNKTENKICLNHYITDQSLKILFESLYNAQSYLHLINVYDSEEDKKLFKKFQEENKWIGNYVQNYEYSELGSFRSIKRSKIFSFISGFFEFVFSGKIGNYLERKLSEVQSSRIEKDKLYKKSGGRITISGDQLEFHPDSHEADIIPEFNKRMKELGLIEFSGQKDSGLNSF